MKKILFLLLLFVISISNVEARKYALIIAIGDYPSYTGWSTISSVNDIPLIKGALESQGFAKENISVLVNKEATKKGIIEAFEFLKQKLKPGDIVVLHYSGHGQQIFDNNGDEIDFKDEAIIPYGAFAEYNEEYQGQNHLRDDELAVIIASIRNTLGSNGQLLFMLDSCHSGSSTRGGKTRGGKATFAPPNWEEKKGEKPSGSDMMEKVTLSKNASPFVMISGASANELNYEYEGYGSLSYAFSKAMNELGSDFTYRQLFSKIASNMNVISPKQTPTIEGDLDYKLFKGEYVKQQTYFPVKKIARPDVIKINSGKLQGLFKNTTVFILPSGTNTVTEDKIIAKGKIVFAKYNEASIKLDKELESTNEKDFWVFIDQPSFGDIELNVFMDESIKDEEVSNRINTFLIDNNIGKITDNNKNADVIIEDINGDFLLLFANGGDEFSKIENSRGTDKILEVENQLFNYAQGKYLKNLSIKNYKYEFDFKLIPIEFDDEIGIPGDLLADSLYYNSGILEVQPGVSHVVLQVSNKSKKPIYFSIIEINSKGEIAPFMPNDECNLNSNERKIAPGQTMIFKDCIYSFGPPYEKLMLKGFASSSPINFTSTIKSRGTSSSSKRGNENPLERFISNSYTQSRGASASNSSGKIDAFSNEFIYEIVK